MNSVSLIGLAHVPLMPTEQGERAKVQNELTTVVRCPLD